MLQCCLITNYFLYLLLGKLLSKAQKVAYTILNKVGNPREGTSIMMGDRVGREFKYLSKLNKETSHNPG